MPIYLLHPPIFIWSPPWILPGHPLFQRPEAPSAARRQVDEWPRTQWPWESWPRSWKRDSGPHQFSGQGPAKAPGPAAAGASGWEEAEARMAGAAELGLTSSWYPTSFCHCKHLGDSIPSTSAEAWKFILRWGQKRGPWIWEVCLSGLGPFLRVQSGVWLWLQSLRLDWHWRMYFQGGSGGFLPTGPLRCASVLTAGQLASLRVNHLRDCYRSNYAFSNLTLTVTHHHFCHVLLNT